MMRKATSLIIMVEAIHEPMLNVVAKSNAKLVYTNLFFE